MNAYITNGNAYNLNSFYGYGSTPTGLNGFLNAPAAQPLAPEAGFPMVPQDSFIPSSALSGNFNYGVQDVCDCQFGNGISQDAFIVPAGDQDNPYQNYNATSMELPALQGQSPQQSLEALLAQLGITPELLMYLQSQGIDLLALIAQANGMDGLGSLQTGQDLVLPTTMPANDTPSVVYMPAPAPSSSGSSRPRRERRDDRPASQPAPAAPEPAPAPARPRHGDVVPVGVAARGTEQEYRVVGTNIRFR